MRGAVAVLLGIAATAALLATPVRAAGVPGLGGLRAHARPAATSSGPGRHPCLLTLFRLICVV
ncbi:hypothetical protein J7W19_29945 [Streptomyces mobaraensis NBRC 13819 = DSM 40847]|uniref:Uncharacterized protein n=1 Tax=Streptomyces mobaraensis (strain ATCC 29032 / DSM 40847 / JCM 4168 / NBRC 13819 / NCIMB 11159 / IPCR 16-22) TaxID=1223523 RepID=M3CCJ6_STRM1|nr:hypothetical protein [Streptomyces mobaraensis]EMF01716.1 hypothetical protein H340_04919 [Streptomyces mobaraensis NBRC 13819 = DSM 40847]QTT77045.1 hypothetical protein J7W19_29945 [Streptomyces mobaraensis NBRC 13819 = DSM 40847]